MSAASSTAFSPNTACMLRHYASGQFPNWLNGKDGAVGWQRPSHRGVQWMKDVIIPKGQKRYVVTDRFEFRFNASVREVLVACADPAREGKTWITPELVDAYEALQRSGHLYTAEAWQEGKLAGGLFGVQIGGFVSVESMFHRANHASKFAYGHLLLRMQERGFELLDVNFVQPHFAQFGAVWIPQWKYEAALRANLAKRIPLGEGMPTPGLSPAQSLLLAVSRRARALKRRIASLFSPIPAPAPASSAQSPSSNAAAQNTAPQNVSAQHVASNAAMQNVSAQQAASNAAVQNVSAQQAASNVAAQSIAVQAEPNVAAPQDSAASAQIAPPPEVRIAANGAPHPAARHPQPNVPPSAAQDEHLAA